MKKAFTLLFLLSFLLQLFSQSTSAHRFPQELVFDGKLDEAMWQDVPVLPLIQSQPNYGNTPTERTEIRMAYDDNYIYLGGKNFVSKPEYIRANTYKRDALGGGTDYFGMVLDTYNDKENSLAFFTSAAGFRWDAAIFNDANDDTPFSLDWNTFWDVKTWVSDSVWHVETRIPWSSLRFQDVNGKVTMGFTTWRFISAKSELVMFPAISQEWGGNSMWKPSQAHEFSFEGIYSQKPLYIAPYALLGLQQNVGLNTAETAYETSIDPTYEAGLDLKYSLTSNLTLDLTANTDFAQVEADDQQVNLTRFNLFFPEKRLFFQEKASVFDFKFEGFNRLFYSRRIGINDEGDPTRIYGGARLTGRVGKSDIGFINMQTAKSGDANSENFGLVRMRRQVINKNSYVGGMLANRTDFKGDYNTGVGVDGIFRVVGQDFLTVRVAQTYADGNENNPLSLDPTRIFVNWNKRQYSGFSYNLNYSRAGKDYAPAMGFELRENYTRVESQLFYGWAMDEESKILRTQAQLFSFRVTDNETGDLQTWKALAGFNVETKNAQYLSSWVEYTQDVITEEFDLGKEVVVPEGTYEFISFNGYVETPGTELLRAGLEFSGGTFYGGTLFSAGLSPSWTVNSNFNVSAYYGLNKIDFEERNQSLTSQLARVRLEYLFNTKLSLAGFIQYNNLDEILVSNVRLRFNPKEGNDLFIVYNDLLNSNREREMPTLLFSQGRVFILKYTYTFQL